MEENKLIKEREQKAVIHKIKEKENEIEALQESINNNCKTIQGKTHQLPPKNPLVCFNFSHIHEPS